MGIVLKSLRLLGVFALVAFVAAAGVAWAANTGPPPLALALPIWSACVLIVVGWNAGIGGRLFSAKRFTAATGG